MVSVYRVTCAQDLAYYRIAPKTAGGTKWTKWRRPLCWGRQVIAAGMPVKLARQSVKPRGGRRSGARAS